MAEKFPATFPYDFGDEDLAEVQGIQTQGDGTFYTFGEGRITLY